MQEPAIQNHLSGEPANTEQALTQQIDQSRRKMAAESGDPIRSKSTAPFGDQPAIALQPVPAVISLRGNNRLRRQESGFNRRPDSFAALRIRDTRRLPGQ